MLSMLLLSVAVEAVADVVAAVDDVDAVAVSCCELRNLMPLSPTKMEPRPQRADEMCCFKSTKLEAAT